VTVLAVIDCFATVWWGSAMAALLVSFLAALSFPWPRRRGAGQADPPPVTAIVPVKELDADFDAAQSSLFAQAYPDIEILIAAAEQQSPALAAARRVQRRYPDVSSRIMWSGTKIAVSPKLNNLWMPVAQARHDLILTKDSNVLLAPGDVECFVRHFDADVGLVSAIPLAVEPKSPAAWIEASIINCYYARMLMLARMAGLGFGLGKVMLFRRSDIDRAGGFQSVAWALGEDSALSDAMARLGLRTVLADRVTRQPLGMRRLKDVWERQLRWKSIWRFQNPSVFIGALSCSALLAALAGAVAAPVMHFPPQMVAAATLGFWFLVETSLCLFKGWPVSLWSPLGFVGREILDLLTWLRALTVSEVKWAGENYRLARPKPSVRFPEEMAPALRRDARSNDGL
jgi:ceramide glucosyltransferase